MSADRIYPMKEPEKALMELAKEREQWGQMTSLEKRPIAIRLLMERVAPEAAEAALGLEHGTLRRWQSEDAEGFRAEMKSEASRRALLEIPKNFHRLRLLRDQAENEDTSRKAVADLQRMAGVPIDPLSGAQGASIVVNAENAQINQMGVSQLEKEIIRLGRELGPQMGKIAERETSDGRGKIGTGGGGGKSGKRPAGEGGAVPGAGEKAPALEGQPTA